MRTPRYKKTFLAWLTKQGFAVDRHVYNRSQGSGQVQSYYFGDRDVTKPLVIFVHGFGNNVFYSYIQIYKFFLQNNFQVYSFDLDGHGSSSTTSLRKEYFASSLTDAIQNCRQSYENKNIYVVGHSLGGVLALSQLNKLQSIGVQKVCLMSVPDEINVSKRGYAIETASLFSKTVQSFKSDYGLYGLLPPILFFKRKESPVRLGVEVKETKYVYVRELIQQLIARVQPCDLPVLVLSGENDQVASMASYKRIRALLPGAVGSLVAQETHLSMPFSKKAMQSMAQFWQST